MILSVRPREWLGWLMVLGSLTACAPQPTSIPVTLTPPAPTSTAAPVDLSPLVELGASLVHADGTKLVAVPAGEFVMGHGSADNPQHSPILSDYWIYSTEVTNAQYSLCVRQGWCTPPHGPDNPAFSSFEAINMPVVGVTHEQAGGYCAFMGGALPTEAQWEKAARGVDGRAYAWGNNEPTCDDANIANCEKHAAAVTAYPDRGSPYGALNTIGNVYEWVADWYDPLYYEASPPGDPPGPQTGRARVIRSSGYRSTADQSLAYARSYSAPNDHRPDLGFRCVLSNPDVFAPACLQTPALGADEVDAITADCPEISIDVQVSACRYGGGAVVTFNNDHPRDPNASFGGIVGCTLISGQPGSYPVTFECRQASTGVMSSSCTYAGIPPGTCPRNYVRDPSTGLCVWSGARVLGIECPPGEFYDPVQHCCRITTGELADFPVCPAGSVFTESQQESFACLPAALARSAPAIVEAIDQPVCGDLCELTVELCSVRNLVFCPTTCACLAVGRKCPAR